MPSQSDSHRRGRATKARARLRLLSEVLALSDRRTIVIVTVGLILLSFAGAVQAYALKWIVDGALDDRLVVSLAAAVVAALATGGRAVAARLVGDTNSILVMSAGLRLDTRLHRRVAEMPGIEHFDNPAYLDRLKVMEQGGHQLVAALVGLGYVVANVAGIFVALIFLAEVDPVLVLLPLFAVPLLLLAPVAKKIVDEANVAASECGRSSKALHSYFLELNSASEMRVFRSQGQLDQIADAQFRSGAMTVFLGTLRSIRVQLIGWIFLVGGYAGALLWVGQSVVAGEASVGDLLLVSQLALNLNGSLAHATSLVGQASETLLSIDRYLWLQTEASDQAERWPGVASPPAHLQDGIRFENVSFTYPGGDRVVLFDVSCHVAAGTSLAIVGPNGAGKSTLVKLLTGLYQPDDGAIVIDGNPLTDLDIKAWRDETSVVFQDYLRLQASLQDSIGIGDRHRRSDAAAVIEALRRADSLSLVEKLPDGLETKLGKAYHDGSELSGGEWQRVAISRAMMRPEPLLLILDEPTSALDPSAEHQLFERCLRARDAVASVGGITVFTSHRFSSAVCADQILVLDEGVVVEQGSHDVLRAAGGLYARLFESQASGYA